jgi:hypothetical protein
VQAGGVAALFPLHVNGKGELILGAIAIELMVWRMKLTSGAVLPTSKPQPVPSSASKAARDREVMPSVPQPVSLL